MMKTIQAIIHCSDRVVILVHAEGDVGQSTVGKLQITHAGDKSETSHLGLWCPNNFEKLWPHVVFVQHILTSKKKKLKIWKSQEDSDRNYDVICWAGNKDYFMTW